MWWNYEWWYFALSTTSGWKSKVENSKAEGFDFFPNEKLDILSLKWKTQFVNPDQPNDWSIYYFIVRNLTK